MAAMSGAELKSIRESLGLPVPVLAKLLGINKTNLIKMEGGVFPVPDGIATEELPEIIERRNARARQLYKEIGPEKELITYRVDDDMYIDEGGEDFGGWGARWHRAMCLWVKQNIDPEVRIVFEGEEGVHDLEDEDLYEITENGGRLRLPVYKALVKAGFDPTPPPPTDEGRGLVPEGQRPTKRRPHRR